MGDIRISLAQGANWRDRDRRTAGWQVDFGCRYDGAEEPRRLRHRENAGRPRGLHFCQLRGLRSRCSSNNAGQVRSDQLPGALGASLERHARSTAARSMPEWVERDHDREWVDSRQLAGRKRHRFRASLARGLCPNRLSRHHWTRAPISARCGLRSLRSQQCDRGWERSRARFVFDPVVNDVGKAGR